MDSRFRGNDEASMLIPESRIPNPESRIPNPESRIPNPESRIPNPEFPMDTVFIEDLRIETVIGIYDWERKIRQVVAIDLEMAFDNRKPAASDDIDDTLNYKAVSKRLIAFVEGSSFQLVETLAERCAEIVREEFGVPWLRLKLSKPGAVRGSKAVGVVVERGEKP
jgi:dihydroneopterin aldolase